VSSASSAVRGAPRELWLWAWERPERLEFLAGTDVGVAYLAATLILDGNEVDFRPRRQVLRVAAGTRLAAVVRLEVRRGVPFAAALTQRDRLVEHVLRLVAEAPGVERVQIDFDARESERAFYVELMRALRERLPARQALGMTALASWCFGDAWVGAFDPWVDEVVPMVFTMGSEGEQIRRRLTTEPFPERRCRGALGVRLDEPLTPISSRVKVYAFSSQPWTERSFFGLSNQLGEALER
jgi:hypothetical protein